MNDLEEETTINNVYDYSNIVPTIENIMPMIQYCDQVFNQFLKLIEEDEVRNEKLKYEFKNYNYKKSYRENFEVTIRQKNFNTISCKNYNSFVEAINSGQLLNIDRLEIELRLDYSRGKHLQLVHHENSFHISFKPYEIKFMRKANYKEEDMEQIENSLNTMLQKFSVANTIFCSK